MIGRCVLTYFELCTRLKICYYVPRYCSKVYREQGNRFKGNFIANITID